MFRKEVWTLALIIVSIIKWTGIIVLSVIGFILAVVAGVLLVPVRYRIYIEKKEQVYVKGHAAWLLHLLHLSFLVEGGQEKHVLRILGIPLYGSEKSGKKSKSRRKKSQTNQSRRKKSGGEESNGAELSEGGKEKPLGEETDLTSPEKAELPKEGSGPVLMEKKGTIAVDKDFSESENPPQKEKPVSGWKKYKQKLQEFVLSIRHILGKIRNGFQQIKEMFREGTGEKNKDSKMRKLCTILLDENTSQLWRMVWRELAALWKHSQPRKLTGWLHFGASDPGTTGQLLGLLSVGYGLTGGKIQLVPDFEESVLEGDLEMRGRIRIIHVLLLAKRIFWSKQWKHFKSQVD